MIGPYRVIIADPPWEYANPRAIVGGKPEHIQVDVSAQYKTLSLPELRHLAVPAAESCLLFLWVTNPFLCDGSGAMIARSWGFTPKSVLTWAKVQTDGNTASMKTGHWFRSATEHVIFAVRGNVSRPEGYPALPTWFRTGRLPHSVKPDRIHEYAELCCPQGPRLEMFARRKRRGWDAWGDQAPSSAAING